jgi:ankyrin repeat protein
MQPVHYLVTHRVKNRAGDLPLHVACERKGSPNLIRLLIEHNPGALRVPNQKGDLPIHVACRFESSWAICQILVQSGGQWGRDALKAANSGGDLPLHVATAQRGLSQQVLQLLVEEGPDAIVVPNAEGNLPLHLACGAPPPTATEVRHGPAANTTTTSASLSVLELLTGRWPDSVHTANGKGKLPLHVACATKHPNLTVVTLLLTKGPRDIRTTDTAGFLPLHTAVGHTHSSLAVVQRLVHAWADGAPGDKEANDEGGPEVGPLEVAAVVHEPGDPPRVPEPAENALGGLKIKTPTEGHTPLHLACYYKAPLDVVQFLVHRWPQAIFEQNEKSDTPVVLVNKPYRGVPSQDVKAWLSTLQVVPAEEEEEEEDVEADVEDQE